MCLFLAVNYIADQSGFYPQLSHEVKNTKAVEDEKNRHIALYNKIAESNLQPVPNVNSLINSENNYFKIYNSIFLGRYCSQGKCCCAES
jgi:hypothetical protein